MNGCCHLITAIGHITPEVHLHGKGSNSMEIEDMPREYYIGMRPIVHAGKRATSQLIVLDEKIRDLNFRIERCSQTGNKAYKYSLEQRRMVTESVRAMYESYLMKNKAVAASLFINTVVRNRNSTQNLSLMENNEMPPILETEGE